MEKVGMKVERRTASGKKDSARLRREGKVPCVMYGGKTSEKLAVDSKVLFKTLSGESGNRVILNLEIEGTSDVHSTVLKELQYHPVTDRLVHADLLEIDLSKPLKVSLPVKHFGDPIGVKIKGGELRVHIREINVECLPEALPSEIKVDIAELDINKIIRVADIPVPEGITKLDNEKNAVFSVVEPKVVEETKEDEESDAVATDEAKPKDEPAADSGETKK